MMDQLVALKMGNGSLESGYAIILQIGAEQSRPAVEMVGTLPPAPELWYTYQRWQMAYRRLGLPFRLEACTSGFATNVSRIDDCRDIAVTLSQQFNQWLAAASFRPLQDKLLERLDPQDTIRLIVQTQDPVLQQLPWSAWEFCDRYPHAEIAFSAPTFERMEHHRVSRSQVRVLAVLGHSQGIDVATDQRLLNLLPQAQVEVLEQPSRQLLNERLWEPEGWDILFFAGHSTSHELAGAVTGRLFINPAESLTIPELKHALKKSLTRGLQIAIFNSCDGLGLARSLADLQIPQVLVMREPVPDQIAHEFLKAFLAAFARGETFYLAVREAREKLQGLEHQFPCATWLPTIFQNPADPPPTWCTLTQSLRPDRGKLANRRWAIAIATAMATALTLGARQMGWLQSWELQAWDQMMHWQPAAQPDARLLVVTVTEADVQAQSPDDRRGSLADSNLLALLDVLTPMQPRLIGLDIYRDFPVRADQPGLVPKLEATDNFFAICKSSVDGTGLAPPPEVPSARIGFSDFVHDRDNVLRRQLLYLTPEPNSPCQAPYAFATLLAKQYLAAEGMAAVETADGFLQLGEVVLQPLETNFGGYQGVDAGGHQVMVNYRPLKAPENIAERVTLADVLSGQVSEQSVRDRIVLIGTTAESFGDYWQTPYPGSSVAEREAAGVFMQAHMISHLLGAVLDDRPLIKAWPTRWELLWIVGWGSLGGLLTYGLVTRVARADSLKLGLSVLTATVTLVGLSWLLLIQWGYWVPVIPAAIALVGAPLVAGAIAAIFSQKSTHP